MIAGGSGAQTRAFTGGCERRKATGLRRETRLGLTRTTCSSPPLITLVNAPFHRPLVSLFHLLMLLFPFDSRVPGPVRVTVDSDPASDLETGSPGLFSGHLPVGKLEPVPRLGTLSPASSRVIVKGLSGRRQSQPGPGNKCPARALSRVAEISPGLDSGLSHRLSQPRPCKVA